MLAQPMRTDLTPVEALRAARAVIEHPSNWCRFKLTDYHGAYCAIGAINKVVCHDQTRLQQTLNVLRGVLGDSRTGAISTYNNTHTHAEVLALFDKAIARSDLFEAMKITKDVTPTPIGEDAIGALDTQPESCQD